MDKEKIREIVYILVAIVVAIIAVKLFIWLLPIVLIALLALYIYGLMKNRNKSANVRKDKKKDITIIDEENK